MPDEQQSKAAGNIDVADFGDKDLEGAYKRGTKIELPDGSRLDIADVPDVIGGKAKPPKRRAK